MAPMMIDVRQRSEYDMGHITGALNIELGELQEHLDGLPRELPVVTVCAAGMRATTDGSILQRDGRANVQVVGEAGTLCWLGLNAATPMKRRSSRHLPKTRIRSFKPKKARLKRAFFLSLHDLGACLN